MTEESTDEIFTVTVVHRAPPELVFSALTTPEHLTHFWGPEGTHTPVAGIVVELRPGGVFETTMINDRTGEEHTMRAVYVEVDPPRRLIWRERGSGMITELTFTDRGAGVTEVTTTQRGMPAAMRTPAARAGWRTALDRHAAYIASLAAGATQSPIASRQGDPTMTTDDASILPLVGPQFSALAAALGAQPESVADAASLCTGWSVRHVVAHLTMPARYDPAAFMAELAAVGHDFDTLSETIARRDGRQPFASLLDDLRSDTMARWTPPGGGAIGALSHVVIHGLDISSAIGLGRTADDTATRVVLDFLSDPAGNPFGVTTGHRLLRATDLDWHSGEGEVTEASSADLILALANRERALAL